MSIASRARLMFNAQRSTLQSPDQSRVVIEVIVSTAALVPCLLLDSHRSQRYPSELGRAEHRMHVIDSVSIHSDKRH